MTEERRKPLRREMTLWIRAVCALLALLLVSPVQGQGTVRAAEMTDNLTAELTGAAAVSVNEAFTLTYGLREVTESVYGLNRVTESVYAQDVTIQYDPEMVEYVSAVSLKDGFQIIDARQSEGQVRLVAASVGAEPTVNRPEELIRLEWKARPLSHTASTTISLSSILVADGEGTESAVAGVSHSLTINAVDKTALQALILEAQSKHDAAVEGTAVGQYPAGSKAKLQQAIAAAQAVAADPSATAQQVAQAAEQLEQALRLFAESVIGSQIEGDLNGDSKLSIGDLAIVAAAIGKSSGDADWAAYRKADLNHDGKVDAADLAIVARLILQGTPEPEQSPQADLESLDEVKAGQTFDVTFGLTSVTGSVYAQDVTFTYDTQRLSLISAAQMDDSYPVLEQHALPSGVRVLLVHRPLEGSEPASQAGAAGGKYVRLQFKALEGAAENSAPVSIEVSGVIADESGKETQITPAVRSIRITPPGVPGSGDMNGDGRLTVGDLALVVKGYGQTSQDADWESVKQAALNMDLRIDILDLSEMARRILQ